SIVSAVRVATFGSNRVGDGILGPRSRRWNNHILTVSWPRLSHAPHPTSARCRHPTAASLGSMVGDRPDADYQIRVKADGLPTSPAPPALAPCSRQCEIPLAH